MKKRILVSLVLVASSMSRGEGRELNYDEAQLYGEIAYEVGLYYGFGSINKAFEKTKGHGIKRMPWQPIDDRMREVFHPSEYGHGPKDKEKPYNYSSDVVNRGMAYYTLAAVPFYLTSGKRLGGFLTIVHMIESTFYLNTLLRTVFSRFRPRSVYRSDTDYNEAPRNSFPSGHASQAFAWASAAVLITDLGFTGKCVFYGLATGASLFRLSGGQHFFSDLVAGAAVGIAVPYGVYGLLHKKDKPAEESYGLELSLRPDQVVLTYRF